MQVENDLKTTAKHSPHKAQPLSAADHPDALLQVATVSALTGRGVSTIHSMVRAQKFPAPIRNGLRCTRWRAGDVTAWLKAHYPEAFMAAVLSSDMEHTDKVVSFIDECAGIGLEVTGQHTLVGA